MSEGENTKRTHPLTNTTLHAEQTARTEISKFTELENLEKLHHFSNPIDLTKEIKYFKILVDVDDQYRSNLIRTLEKVNQGYLNLVYGLIKSHILLTNLEHKKEFQDFRSRKQGGNAGQDSEAVDPREVRRQAISDRERDEDFKEWSDMLISDFDWFLKKAGRSIGDLSRYSEKLNFQQSDELEELSYQLQEKASKKMFFDLQKKSTEVDQLCINLLSKVSSSIGKIEKAHEGLNHRSIPDSQQSSIGLRTVDMRDRISNIEDLSDQKSTIFHQDEENGNMLSSGSLSNLTLEAISPGKGNSSVSSLKATKIIKPPKPKPPKSTVSKNSLLPARSYDDTQKKSHHNSGAIKHRTLNNGSPETKQTYPNELSISNMDNMFKKSSRNNKDSFVESHSDTKQSIYISELNDRVKAMEQAVKNTPEGDGNDRGQNVTPFGFFQPEEEIVAEETQSKPSTERTNLSEMTHFDSQIPENKKLKSNNDLIDISFAKKQTFAELDNQGISESVILQINEITQTFGPVDSADYGSELLKKESIGMKQIQRVEIEDFGSQDEQDSMWLDGKLVLENAPLMSFDTFVRKIDKELIDPGFEVLKIKPFLGKYTQRSDQY